MQVLSVLHGSVGLYHYQTEPDISNPTAAPGMYEVKSGLDATALDGSKYADW